MESHLLRVAFFVGIRIGRVKGLTEFFLNQD